MGSPTYEPERRPNESPQHLVTLQILLHRRFAGRAGTMGGRGDGAPGPDCRTACDPFPSSFKGEGSPRWRPSAGTRRMSSAAASAKMDRTGTTACRARPNGNTPAAPVRPARSMSGRRSPRIWRITAARGGAVCGESGGKSVASDVYDGVTYGSGAYGQGPTGGIPRRRRRRGGHSRRTASASPTCTAMSGNIASTRRARITPTHPRTEAPF